ncbi:sulfite exporter TauE/SafE family protein [Mycobacterium talmoniae]|uniref:Probable membrane transporter protein n=1 Tax=Mycobacterium talmoniae TaxID=1858794 RepID=A0A1S1NQP6_9MYCO|nr:MULTISPECIES: sulfite exporter TauE/SafE family protein [Mycobacterium]OHV05899.1 permease [Mycobacterium talmoniae]TDH57804.1 sulfite exporter TauE/SafE family protein [Mycobacterium eburneum]
MLILCAVLLGVGCLTGLTTVLFGFGGGFVTVPVVAVVVAAYGGGDAMHTAVATSTAVMLVTASWATLAQHRAGRLQPQYLWPMIAFIAVGAALGAIAADWVSNTVLTVLFVVYLAGTIADSVTRSGFLSGATGHNAVPKPLSRTTATVGGIGVGAVASFLGVGGSVMTVPLLRRKGLPMADATALANPLSVPVAAVATIVYAVTGPAVPQPGQLGHVDLTAATALLGGSLPTIALAPRVIGSIPDRVHAIAYLILLTVVLVVMTVLALR